MATTITKIAKETNVSKALVSRLLSGDPTLRIAAETQERIIAVHDKLGGLKGHAPKGRKNLAYNIVFPINGNFASEWSDSGALATCPFVRSLRLFLKSKGFRLSFCHFNPSELKDEIADYIESPDYCDGLFLYYGVVDKSIAEIILNNKFPHVSSDSQAERFGVNTVTAYLAGAYCKAISYLEELGHERIGYIGPVGSKHEKVYRYPAFAAALAENYLPNSPDYHCNLTALPANQLSTNSEWRTETKEKIHQWFKKGPKVSAVICKNDHIAQIVVEVMLEIGLKPGKDLSIIGHGNTEIRTANPLSNPILTTIDNPDEIIGHRCGELLLMQIQDKYNEIVHEHIPVDFIIRETTGKANGQ